MGLYTRNTYRDEAERRSYIEESGDHCKFCGEWVSKSRLQYHYMREHSEEWSAELDGRRKKRLDSLSANEATELAANEAVIERGLKTFYEVGAALLSIRDKRLYRASYATFEDYCQERWQLKRQRAYELMDAAKVTMNLSEISDISPKRESHVAPLASLEPDAQRIVWEVVQQTAPGGKVTAAHVQSVATVFKEVVATKALDDGSGEQITVPDVVKAAVTEETYERMKRQETYIREKQEQKERRQQEREAAKVAIPAKLSGDAWRLIEGDFATAQIEPNSVDFIITDPPYLKEHLPLFSALSAFAERVLKPGGSLLCMSGQSYLPEVMTRLSECLTYNWTHAYLTPGGQSPQIWQRKVNTFWKPMLHFVKGDYMGDWTGDVVSSAVNDNDKRFHGWQQSESGMAALVERFTYPDQLIVDPMCGSGTTGIVAVRLHRRFIGVDTDRAALAAASERLAACTPNQP
jgi:16S rRNA G966 N2-methylase RsmD